MKKTKTPKKSSEDVTITLKIGAKEYKASAPTVSEALSQIRPEKISLRGLFTVNGFGNKYETWMFPQQLKKLLFGSDTVREIFEKRTLINKKYV